MASTHAEAAANFGKGLNRCCEVLKPLGERLWLLPGNHETHDSTRAACERYGGGGAAECCSGGRGASRGQALGGFESASGQPASSTGT